MNSFDGFNYGNGDDAPEGDEVHSFDSPAELFEHVIATMPVQTLTESIKMTATMLAVKQNRNPRYILADLLAQFPDDEVWEKIALPKFLSVFAPKGLPGESEAPAPGSSHEGGKISDKDAADLRAMFADGPGSPDPS